MRRFLAISLMASVSFAVDLPTSIEGTKINRELSRDRFNTNDVSIEIAKPPRTIVQLDELDEDEFVLSDYHLKGKVTDATYFNAVLEQIMSPFRGREISLDVLNTAAEILEAEFRDRGYILARVVIPKQHIHPRGAHVHFFVDEGKLVTYEVAHNNKKLRDRMEEYLHPLLELDPVKTDDMTKQIYLAGDAPGIKVKATVLPDEEEPGEGQLELEILREKNSHYIKYNNKGNDYVGPGIIQVGVDMHTLFGLDRLDLNYATSQPTTQNLEHFGVDYTTFLTKYGLRLHTSGQLTQTQAHGAISGQGFEGKAARWQVDGTMSVLRTPGFHIFATAGGYWIDSLYNQKTGDRQVFRDRILSLFGEAKTNYSHPKGYKLDANVRATFGIDIGNIEETLVADRSRAEGQHAFTKINTEAHVYFPIGEHFGLDARSGLQFSTTPLFLAEQFDVRSGGYGLAYDIAEVAGDRGWRNYFELSYRSIPNIWLLNSVYPYVYYDFAKITNIGSDTQQGLYEIASMGGGVRMKFFDDFTGNVFAASPITREVFSKGNKHTRVFFEVTGKV